MSFLAAAFLLGFAALALPWWLHRMQERAPAQTVVASLMLMREVEEPVRSRRRLAHRALLALRLALLAALVLAFAQPVVQATADLVVDRARPARLVVLDSSLSMRRDAVWADALATARDLLDADAGDHAVAAAEGLTLLPDFAALAPGWSRFDFAALPERLAAIVATLREPPGGWEYHIVSDFQASAVPQRLNALVGGVWPFVLHPVGGFEDNWAVETVESVPRNSADDARLSVVVASFAAAGRTLAVRVAGQQEDVFVAAGSRRRVTFPLPAATPSQTPYEISIAAADTLPDDDVRRFVRAATQSTAVTVLAPSADAGALGFLKAALQANGVKPTVVQGRRPTPATAGGMDWLRTAAALVLLDPGELQPGTRRRVERHLQQGGGALLIVGPRQRRHAALPIAAGALPTHMSVGAGRRVIAADASHPIVGAGWEDVIVERSLTLDASPRETILALAPADAKSGGAAKPLLVERNIGKGRLLILLTALDRTWSTLVLRPAFVGLVGNVVNYLAVNRPLHAAAGEALALPGASAQIFDADGERALALGETGGASAARLAKPGVYTMHIPGRETHLAVNVDVRESDLRPVSSTFLGRWQAAAAPPAERPQAVSSASDPAATTEQHTLAPWLLALAACLLIAECLAANIGVRRREAVA